MGVVDKLDNTEVVLDWKDGKVYVNGEYIDAYVDENIEITHLGLGIIEVRVGIFCSRVSSTTDRGMEPGIKNGVMLPDLRVDIDGMVGNTYVALPDLRNMVVD